MSQPAPMITRDGRFAYEAAGDEGATPLIFLHGIGGAARAWRQQLATFGDRFRAIAWDMPGYGGSAPLASVSIAALADALQQFIVQIGAEKPILVGHSIGGMIVQKWLVQSPKSARAVVLAQTSPAFGKAEGDWQKSFIAARLGPLDRGETMKSLAPSLVKELVGDAPDPRGMELARECMANVPEASYRAMMLALIGFDQRGTLKDISVPTLLLSGSKDNNAPAPMMAKTATYIPSVEYVELPGVGHLANLERPDVFDKALGGFIDPFAANHG
ncbi:alpha/beta fold hydrolase [Bradyrhizobium sp. GCM10027634]|uniref:alpha/beta fold hydrolase n=1 Tax=unclassified Bradyrhizobium TaxID=2631580 RepID=UPI00188A75DD|nr:MULTISPECIES: alpha/beta hydrolase [unclassified Bradyrhizobium]MDN5004644.1 alpha/beta hydrolase [Bradyrhizobium sp. WYCCWR 12677]QOZ43950.1 alpha/beta hydrolase [Bradyrhizobium sp. CCBAU 53340]